MTPRIARSLFALVFALSACAQRASPPAPAPAPAAAPKSADPSEVAAGDVLPSEPEPASEPASEPEPAPEHEPSPEATPSATPAPHPAPNARDPRRIATQQLPRPDILNQIQALESLYSQTAKTSPDRAEVVRHLADAYVELEYSAMRATDAEAPKLVLAARKKAIENYRRVKDDHPTYAKLDEVLYFAGYEYERGKDLPNARAMYRELIQKFPSSSYSARVPKALKPR